MKIDNEMRYSIIYFEKNININLTREQYGWNIQVGCGNKSKLLQICNSGVSVRGIPQSIPLAAGNYLSKNSLNITGRVKKNNSPKYIYQF